MSTTTVELEIDNDTTLYTVEADVTTTMVPTGREVPDVTTSVKVNWVLAQTEDRTGEISEEVMRVLYPDLDARILEHLADLDCAAMERYLEG